MAARLPRVCGDGPCSSRPSTRTARAAPRMRGWTRRAVRIAPGAAGCPAYAGMDPHRGPTPGARSRRLPRVCGDGPSQVRIVSGTGAAAPRMRGWTPKRRRPTMPRCGCPAYAGMDPASPPPLDCLQRLPRVCGDGPSSRSARLMRTQAAPRMRGWTLDRGERDDHGRGCPAYAGMDPVRQKIGTGAYRLPRVCGDGPVKRPTTVRTCLAAPRMRGWTPRSSRNPLSLLGCPAYAGMDPDMDRRRARPGRLPRVCGDGP